MRINSYIIAPGVFIFVKNFFKSFSAISGTINSTFFIGPIRMTQYGHKNPVGVFWINSDLRDLLSVLQAKVHPGFSGIGRFVNAITGRKIGTMKPFSASHINCLLYTSDAADE